MNSPPKHFNCRCDDFFSVELIGGPRDGEVLMIPLGHFEQFFDGAQFGLPWLKRLYLYTYHRGRLFYDELQD